jgi:RimJ/RimL family protein N-acetyltransferase
MSSYLEGNEASRRAQASAGYREVGRFSGQYYRGGRWLDEVLTELLGREDTKVSCRRLVTSRRGRGGCKPGR